jgi:hypothetical protein
MIVVEGPDGAGKTTLVQEIAAQFPVTIGEKLIGVETETLVPDFKAATEARTRDLNQGMVFDRHPLISGPIYHAILGGTTNAFMFQDFDWLTAMNTLFERNRPTLIYCIPPREVCLEQNAACWPSRTSYDDREGIYDLYLARAALDLGVGRAIHYDYTEGAGHLRSIMGYINRQEFFG